MNKRILETKQFFDAIQDGNYQMVNDMLATTSLEEKNKGLFYATIKGDLALVKLLVEHGAQIAESESLEKAIESNDEAIAAYLLSQEKIDLNIPDRHFSPLMRAVCKNNETMAQLLLDHNADINYKNKNQKTALMTAAGSCCSPYRDKKECNYQGIIKLLLRAQPAINMENEDGETALHYAVENRCFNTVKLLLEAGADSSLKDKCQQTALDKIQKQIHDFAQRKEKFTEIHTMLNSKASTNNHE